ncbi:hypothetical protein [Phaeospirillum tilakii]|uniref:Uncharacterized protein n=1 Tax=Phaeospirillum tilakii TaxID=741673 RepID=A0ABW5CDT1_9PROT
MPGHRPFSLETVMHSGRIKPKDLIEIAADYAEQAIIISDESGLILCPSRPAANLLWLSPVKINNENIDADISTEDFGVNQNEDLPPHPIDPVSGKITGRRAAGRPVFVPTQIRSGTTAVRRRFYSSISRPPAEGCSEVIRRRFLARQARRHDGRAAPRPVGLDRFGAGNARGQDDA